MNFKTIQQLTFVHLCCLITFLLSGFVLAIIQGFLYFTLRKFDKYLYRKINYYFTYAFYSEFIFYLEWWSNFDFLVYMNKEDYFKIYGAEHTIVITNHTSEIDFSVAIKFGDGARILGNSNAFVKKAFQYLPPVGWLWTFNEIIFLERSYEKDKVTIEKHMKELTNYPYPSSILLYPEGTRFTPEKHKVSRNYAEKNGLPLLKHHLTPRTKGFTTCLSAMKGNLKHVLDCTLVFEKGVAPTVMNVLCGNTFKAHVHVSLTPVENIPETEEGAAKWLHERFVIKDKLYDSLIKTGDFFAESGVERITPFVLPRRKYPIIIKIFWIVTILIPILWYSVNLLISGNLLYSSIVIAVYGLLYILFRSFIYLTKARHGSSYGTEKISR